MAQLYGSRYFRVRNSRGNEVKKGELLVSAVDSPIGTWMDLDSTQVTYATVANGNSLGVLTQNVTTSGMTFEERELGRVPDTVPSGKAVTLLHFGVGAEIEIEAPDSSAYDAASTKSAPVLMVTTGTGALSASTAKGTKCSYKNGRMYVAQSGDHAEWEVQNAALTPKVDAAYIRIQFRRIEGNDVA